MASGVSSNSICMSMMCVIPALATCAILADVQIPPPTAMRSVNHVISIVLCRLFGKAACVTHPSRSLRTIGNSCLRRDPDCHRLFSSHRSASFYGTDHASAETSLLSSPSAQALALNFFLLRVRLFDSLSPAASRPPPHKRFDEKVVKVKADGVVRGLCRFGPAREASSQKLHFRVDRIR